MTETNAYGPGNAGDDYLRKPTSCGRVVPTVELRVTDAEGRVLGPDEVGEIWFRGPNLIRGYWGKPEATAETIVDGWLRSGDIGRIDAEGFVYVQDRAKDMVLRAGENIYCAEVEAAIYEHPAVYEAAVFGLPHERLGEEVAAAIVAQARREPRAGGAADVPRAAPRALQDPDPHRAARRCAAAQPGGKDPEARAARRGRGPRAPGRRACRLSRRRAADERRLRRPRGADRGRRSRVGCAPTGTGRAAGRDSSCGKRGSDPDSDGAREVPIARSPEAPEQQVPAAQDRAVVVVALPRESREWCQRCSPGVLKIQSSGPVRSSTLACCSWP